MSKTGIFLASDRGHSHIRRQWPLDVTLSLHAPFQQVYRELYAGHLVNIGNASRGSVRRNEQEAVPAYCSFPSVGSCLLAGHTSERHSSSSHSLNKFVEHLYKF